VIERLADSLGDDGRRSVAALIDTFLTGAPDRLTALRRALAAGSADDARREAHTLKGNASMFGATHLATLSRGLEVAAADGSLDRGGELLARIEAELGEVIDELRARRADLTSS
jgi:HPt (histidine-containing phosphotransfer) domain-containing protein